MGRRNYIFQPRLMETTPRLFLLSFHTSFLSSAHLERSFTSCGHLRIAMNKSQSSTKDLDMSKAHGAPLRASCTQYSCDFHQPPVDLGSEAWMPPHPLAGLLAGLSWSRGPRSYPVWMLIYSGRLAPLADVLHFTTSETQLSAERATCIFRASFNVSHCRKRLLLGINCVQCWAAIGNAPRQALCKWGSSLAGLFNLTPFIREADYSDLCSERLSLAS